MFVFTVVTELSRKEKQTGLRYAFRQTWVA